jgi:hypothetical protein
VVPLFQLNGIPLKVAQHKGNQARVKKNTTTDNQHQEKERPENSFTNRNPTLLPHKLRFAMPLSR